MSGCGKLSGGQRRRLDLAVALCGDPELLFLDEPTTGFDPTARRQAWDMVKRLTGSGRTVLLTTHFMDEAQVLADRFAVMVDGRIVAEGTPSEVVDAGSTADPHPRARSPTGRRPCRMRWPRPRRGRPMARWSCAPTGRPSWCTS